MKLTVTAPVALSSPAIDLQKRAEGDDIDAMFALENTFASNGNDHDVASWFSKAAALVHVKAMNAIGYMREAGRGVLQDHAAAADWYQKAMMRGNPDAMINRGILLEGGLGVSRNRHQAYIHSSLGATYAVDPALRVEGIKLRDEVAKQMTAQQLNFAQAGARSLATQIQK